MKLKKIQTQSTVPFVKGGLCDLPKYLKSYLLFTKNRQPAFTLVELLVAMVITGMMLTLVMASYWTFLQTQQKMKVSRELQAEVRFALNRITDKIRDSKMNIAGYDLGGDCNQNFNTTLCLTDNRGNHHFFNYDIANKSLDFNGQPLISTQKFIVESLHFDFSPKEYSIDTNASPPRPAGPANPKNLASRPRAQPKVTILLRATPRNARYSDLVIENQTTISSRQY